MQAPGVERHSGSPAGRAWVPWAQHRAQERACRGRPRQGGLGVLSTSQLSALRARKQPTGGWSRKTLWSLSKAEGASWAVGERPRDPGAAWHSASPGEGPDGSRKHAAALAGVQPGSTPDRRSPQGLPSCAPDRQPQVSPEALGSGPHRRQDPRGACLPCGVYTDGTQAQAAQSAMCVAVVGAGRGGPGQEAWAPRPERTKVFYVRFSHSASW